MQSYYVDEWERQRDPARGDLHPARLRRRLAARRRAPAPGGDARLRPRRLDRRPPLRRAPRAGSGSAPDGALRASYGLTRDDARRLAFGIARAAEIHFAAGATEVYPNIARVGVLRPGDLAEFEATAFKPSELRLEAFHPMGTARIAADPRRGRLRRRRLGERHRDLYVADASLFPTSVGVNPMMTVIAFAKQVARGVAAALAGRWRRRRWRSRVAAAVGAVKVDRSGRRRRGGRRCR